MTDDRQPVKPIGSDGSGGSNGGTGEKFAFDDDPTPIERWQDFGLPVGQRKDDYAALIRDTAFSWRGSPALAPVSDQAEYETCVSHAACRMLETMLGKSGRNVRLDAECLHQCVVGLTCDTAVVRPSFVLDAMTRTGAPANNGFTPGRACPDILRLTLAPNGHRLGSPEDMKLQISRVGPVLATIRVDAQFDAIRNLTPYRGSPGRDGGYDHAVLVVGYDDADETWLIQNSRGTGWGHQGFGRITYGAASLLADQSHPVLCFY